MSFPLHDMRLSLFAFLLAALAAVAPATAQDGENGAPIALEGPHTLCVLYAPEADNVYTGVNPIREAPPLAKGGGATFDVSYTGFSAEAQAAFQYAVDIWSAHLQSAVPIKVNASFSPLGTNVLGSARANFVRAFNRQSRPLTNTFYGDPLADALAGSDLGNGADDIIAQFSSNFSNWYFGTDGNTPSEQGRLRLRRAPRTRPRAGLLRKRHLRQRLGDRGVQRDFWRGVYGLVVTSGARIPVIFDRFVEDANGSPCSIPVSIPTLRSNSAT